MTVAPEAPLSRFSRFLNLSLVACLLGNFVDQYDLFLFGHIRVSSLKSLGLNSQAIFDSGILLLNCQMAGMLMGGLAAGILGDKRGRLTILFGSIIVYSVANLSNAFVTSVPQYAFCRFLAGFGLAGEIGACITVVLETLPYDLRGYGTMTLIAFGHLAAVTGSTLANLLDWRTNYFLGGSMGLIVLLLRFKAQEPEIFLSVLSKGVDRGDLMKIFLHPSNFLKYLKGILITTPTWFVFSILVIFAPEITQRLGFTVGIPPEKYMPYYFGSLIFGDITGGLLGQWLRTRKWVIALYIAMIAMSSYAYLFEPSMSSARFLGLISLLGFFSGYSVLSFTAAAEQFGTNLRATAATSTPNIVRSSAIFFTLTFSFLKDHLGVTPAAVVIGVACLGPALFSALKLEETYGKNLDYIS